MSLQNIITCQMMFSDLAGFYLYLGLVILPRYIGKISQKCHFEERIDEKSLVMHVKDQISRCARNDN